MSLSTVRAGGKVLVTPFIVKINRLSITHLECVHCSIGTPRASIAGCCYHARREGATTRRLKDHFCEKIYAMAVRFFMPWENQKAESPLQLPWRRFSAACHWR